MRGPVVLSSTVFFRVVFDPTAEILDRSLRWNFKMCAAFFLKEKLDGVFLQS